MLQRSESTQCRAADNKPLLTLLDLRNDNHFTEGAPPPQFITPCPVLQFMLDDMQKQETRNAIPADGPVITVTETGNRDEFVIRYLSQFDRHNIKALKFGMRGWLKQRYPTR